VLKFQTVDEKVTNTEANRLTARQQRVLLRAVVGSLVLSAALASTAQGTKSGPSQQENFTLAAARLQQVDPQPFRDLLARARRMAAAGELKPGDYFTFTVEAARDENGALGGVRITEGAAVNARWRRLTEEFVRVLGDSRALAYLEGVERVTLTVSLGERFTAELAADAAEEGRATQLAVTSGLLLGIARQSQRGLPGVEILNNMKASASGKRLALKLEMSREEVGNLLSQSLAIP